MNTLEINALEINALDKINIQCPSCRKRFDGSYDDVCVCFPCGHLVHNKPDCKHNICKICKSNIDNFLSEEYVKNDPNFHQNYSDIASVTKVKQTYSIWRKIVGITRVVRLIPTFCGFNIRMFFDYIHDKLHNTLDVPYWRKKWINLDYLLQVNSKIIRILNIHITTEDIDKLVDNNTTRIILCNHSNFHDLFVMASIEPLPFLASPIINRFMLGRAITRTYPHLIVENDVTSKMTEKYKKMYIEIDGKNKTGFQKVIDFLNTPNKINNKLMICPEGMLSHAHYLTKFRTTAFKTGYPVQPVILIYKQNVFDHQNSNMLFLERVDVKVIAMDIMETNGSDKSIEEIRKLMAQKGGFVLSRVENRSLQLENANQL